MQKLILMLCLTLAASSSYAAAPKKPHRGANAPNAQRPAPAAGTIPDVGPLAGIFARSNVLDFSLKAPFQELFTHRQTPNAVRDEQEANFKVDGELSYMDESGHNVLIPVRLSLRGNTSQMEAECSFPKLKMKLKAENTVGTLFEGQKAINLATHCGNSGGLSPYYGRLLDGHSPHREAVAYEMLRKLGIPTYLTRRALGTYVDSTSGLTMASGAQAFFLEDMEQLIQRLGATREIRGADVSIPERNQKMNENNQYIFKSVSESQNSQNMQTASILLFELMIGNFDYKVRIRPDGYSKSLWNMKVVEVTPEKWILFPYDFDLAAAVTGRSFPISISSVMEQVDSSAIQEASLNFKRQKQSLYDLVSTDLAGEDPYGVRILQGYMDQFFAQLP